ncbi:hypothetical protein [Yellowstone lake mimivirus]|uniref:hypothetical protein n=1 Tax=Yellowstone lake mimivirus TaxID=1586712 RepID=UPI0006EB3667|nr:hypothetical protein AR680_gp087 [Yellowstone lake mimivirus]BAT22011.1 hypothetical protein [Yellowstone lake mimivirus]
MPTMNNSSKPHILFYNSPREYESHQCVVLSEKTIQRWLDNHPKQEKLKGLIFFITSIYFNFNIISYIIICIFVNISINSVNV